MLHNSFFVFLVTIFFFSQPQSFSKVKEFEQEQRKFVKNLISKKSNFIKELNWKKIDTLKWILLLNWFICNLKLLSFSIRYYCVCVSVSLGVCVCVEICECICTYMCVLFVSCSFLKKKDTISFYRCRFIWNWLLNK